MSHVAFSRHPLVRAPWRVLLIALAMLVGAMASAQAAQAAYPVKLKATIERIKALDCTDENEVTGGCGSAPDFYARIYFDGSEVLDTEDKVTDDDGDISPSDWSVEKSFDLERGRIGVDVHVRDQDGGFRGPSDPIDVTPGDGRDLHFVVNLAPCALSDGLSAECTVNLTSTPSVVTSGTANDRAELTLKVEVIDADTDGDALLDGWETRGLDTDGDTNVDVDLPAQGANPRRHDLFVEADCLVDRGGDSDLTDETDHSHCPIEGAISDVVTGFANAPGGPRTSNPDGSTGIQLHIDTGALYGAGRVVPVNGGAGVTGSYGDLGGGGTQIAETPANLIVDWDGATGNPATSVYAIKNANFDARRRYAYRYALFAHQTNNRQAVNDCTSGWAETAPANDFIVTLGGLADRDSDGNIEGPCWTATGSNGIDDDGDGRRDEDRVNGRDDDGDGRTDEDGGNHSFGSRAEQAGTFMHEFGHALGLGHGGGDSQNNKPNYLSVMNYSFQSCGVPAAPPGAPAGAPALPGGCDFSRDALASLEERIGTLASFQGLDECSGFDNGVFGFGPLNWNGNTLAGGAAMFEGVSNCQAPNATNVSADANGDSALSNLPGYDDWDNIFYPFYSIAAFTNGVADPIADEPDPQSIERARRFMSELLAPDLAVDKTGPAAASAGDTLQYELALTNRGSGPAFGVTLGDAKPDGSHASFDIGFLKAGAGAQRAVSYAVPCTAGDGDVLTDTATTDGVDLLGERERTPANNRDSLATTVRAPVLELAATATASVRAGEAITYRLTYENSGSGAAGSVRITTVLPADVYYSAALDTGAGPAPDTVTPHADGTTTLSWTIGTVPGDSGPRVVEYTARPSLLFAGGTVQQAAKLTFTNANDCQYAPVTATGSTTIATVAPTRNPLSQGYWKNHPAERTSEILARIQATDQRYDGVDGSTPDGRLSAAEAQEALDARGTPPRLMGSQLLATYFNLATRRINAGTVVRSKTATRIGAANVRDVARYAMATLALPASAHKDRYSDAITALDEINNDKSEVY
jgi:uncharacterized repeat protein (TIGR01451 family)